MTLTDNEGYVILAAMLTALLVGFATPGRRCVSPLLGVGGFLIPLEQRRSQIPEDVQVTVFLPLGSPRP